MKRLQCQAFARVTQRQCGNRAMWGTSYCWIHYPKKTPLIFILLGACLGLLGQIAWDSFTISPEEKKIIELKHNVQEFQNENQRLKTVINQERIDSFDLFSDPNTGIRVYSRRSAISKHYEEALVAYKQGNLLQAKDTLEMILQKEPTNTKVLNLLGVILNELGNVEDARKCLNKAYKLANDPIILNNIEVINKFPGKKIKTKDID